MWATGRAKEGLDDLMRAREAIDVPVPIGIAGRIRAGEVRMNVAMGDVGRACWFVAQD